MYSVKSLIAGSAVAVTATVYYTAPDATTTRLTQVVFTNTDTVPRTITVYLVPTNAAPAATDTIIKTKTLQASETWVAYPLLGMVLSPNSTLQALASAAGVVILKASGVELT